MKTQIAFRVADVGLTGDYNGGDITLDICDSLVDGSNLLSGVGNWTTIEIGRGVYILDLPNLTQEAFISLTATKNTVVTSYDGIIGDGVPDIAVAVRDVENTSPAMNSLGEAVNIINTVMTRVETLSQESAGLMLYTEGWSSTNFTAAFTGVFDTGGYITIYMIDRSIGTTTILGEFDDAGIFTFNTMNGNSFLMLDIDKVVTPGNLTITVRPAGPQSDLKTFTIPIIKGAFTGFVNANCTISGKTAPSWAEQKSETTASVTFDLLKQAYAVYANKARRCNSCRLNTWDWSIRV
jgi:hypothetical protein